MTSTSIMMQSADAGYLNGGNINANAGAQQGEQTEPDYDQMPTVTRSPEDPSLSAAPAPRWQDRLPGLPEVLRFAGAGILVAALSVFLFQRWEAGNDLYRYLTLLGLSAALTAAGLLSGILLREAKGARVFLGLVLLTLPIHFTVLGGLLYSRFGWEAVRSDYPGMVTWQATDPSLLLTTLVGALLVLLPVCWLAVRTFVRRHTLPMTVALFGLSVPLLLPTRSLTLVAPLAMLMTLTVVWLELRVWRDQVALKTREGRFVRALLVLPLALLLGRGLWLYDSRLVLLPVASAAAFSLLLVMVQHLRDRPRLAGLVARLSLVPAALIGWGLAGTLADAGMLQLPYLASTIAAPFVAALLLLSRAVPTGGSRYRLGAALVAIAVTLAELLVFGGQAHALVALLVGVLTLSYGYLMEQKLVLVGGVLAATVGLGAEVAYAVAGFDLGGWLTLAVAGTLAILSASMLERYGRRVVEHWQQARERVADWDY